MGGVVVSGPGGGGLGRWVIGDEDLWVWMSHCGHFYLIVGGEGLNKTVTENKPDPKLSVVNFDFVYLK